MVILQIRSEATFILEYIETSRTIVSDSWRAYFDVISNGYNHLIINPSVNFVGIYDPMIHTLNIQNYRRSQKTSFINPKKFIKNNNSVGEDIYRTKIIPLGVQNIILN
ncbi:hypothetical protein HZS_3277 [Henneguya salminicola]|nr:hypothetical protein HZS_3277 [Henneguya salminicola]